MNNLSAQQIASEFCRQAIELLNQSEIKTRHCLTQLSEEQISWRPEPTMNSIGNLIRHMNGNLQQWGIVALTGEVDHRDRESEFAETAFCSKTELLDQMAETISRASSLWSRLNAERLMERLTVQGFEVTLMQAITHTSSHLVGHTQQLVLLTRLQLGADYKFQWTPDGDRGSLPI